MTPMIMYIMALRFQLCFMAFYPEQIIKSSLIIAELKQMRTAVVKRGPLQALIPAGEADIKHVRGLV